MPNDKQLHSHCTRCGRPREVGERFSARGRCESCGKARMIANRDELAAHSGPFFDHWVERCLRAFGGRARLDALEHGQQTDG